MGPNSFRLQGVLEMGSPSGVGIRPGAELLVNKGPQVLAGEKYRP